MAAASAVAAPADLRGSASSFRWRSSRTRIRSVALLEREPARIGVGLGAQRHFAHGIQFGRERGASLDFAFQVRVRDIARQRHLRQLLLEGLDARMRFMEVGGRNLGIVPDRRGHALGVGERTSGLGGGLFRLRETLLELELALGLRGFVLLARGVQIGLRLLARRSESRAAASALPAEADAAVRLLSRDLSQLFAEWERTRDRSGRGQARASREASRVADQVAKRLQFLARRTLDLGCNGIEPDALGLGSAEGSERSSWSFVARALEQHSRGKRHATLIT